MSKILHIRMLGTFSLEYDGIPVAGLDSVRQQELLAWLLLNRDSPKPRRQIAFQFWPDSSERQAKTNLRKVLHDLKKSLPEAELLLNANYKTLHWNPEAKWTFDVKNFKKHLSNANKAKASEDHEAYESELVKAESLYKGPLFENCYQKWIEPERRRLQTKYLDVLENLVKALEKKRKYSSAVTYSKKLIRGDPFKESSYRTLMHLYALDNDRVNVQKTWQNCVTFFEKELDLQPSSETRDLYKRLLSAHSRKPTDDTEKNLSVSKIQVEWPLVGRKPEWETLLSCWKKAVAGDGNFVTISGDPGIGKSRLGLELLGYVKKQGYPTAYSRSYETAGTLSYSPVTDWLSDPQIRSTLAHLDVIWLNEIARLLPELLSEHPNLSEPTPMRENWQRHQFFEALTNVFRNLKHPTLLLLDDLQWCDRETLYWLNYLFQVKQIPDLLVIGTLRPVEAESNKPLQQLLAGLRRIGCLTDIELYPLDESESFELAGNVSKQESSVPPEDLYRETEGNPLFVVETIRQGQFTRHKTGFQSFRFLPGAKTELELKAPLPPRVNEVISARFDLLTEKVRELMWLAAAIGREFSLQLLYKAAEEQETVIVNSLEELLQHHIIREPHKNSYDFSHDKLRELAYQKMSGARRTMLHKKIARALESMHPENLTTISHRLGFHFDRANVPQQAIHYYQLASGHAREIYANEVSVALLKRALALVEDLPESMKRDQMEHDLRAGLCLTFAHIKAYGGNEVIESCERVYELSKKLNKTPPVPVKRIFAIAKLAYSRIDEAYEVGLELYQQAKIKNDMIELVEACYVLGSVLLRQANYTESKKYYEEGLEAYNPENRKNHIIHFGQDPSVICIVRLAMIEWVTGNEEKSDTLRVKALKESQVIEHPFTLDYIRAHIAWLYNLQGEINKTNEMAEQVLSTSYEHGFPNFISICEILYGWTLYQKGSKKKGIQRMKMGLQEHDTAHIRIDKPYYSSLLAKALGDSGKRKEAIEIFDMAVKEIEDVNYRFMEPEVYRIMGEFYRDSDPSEAKLFLKKAVITARHQNAFSLEKKALNLLKDLS